MLYHLEDLSPVQLPASMRREEKSELTKYKIRGSGINIAFGEYLCTLTICEAAASTGIPLQHSKAASADNASQTPSLEIISLPPVDDSCKI